MPLVVEDSSISDIVYQRDHEKVLSLGEIEGWANETVQKKYETNGGNTAKHIG